MKLERRWTKILEKLMLPILLIQASGEPQFLLAPTTTAGPTENPGDAEPFADYPDSEHSAASLVWSDSALRRIVV